MTETRCIYCGIKMDGGGCKTATSALQCDNTISQDIPNLTIWMIEDAFKAGIAEGQKRILQTQSGGPKT